MHTARRVVSPLALVLAACLGSGGLAQPLSTGFTYQGAISQAGQAASGVFDLRFRLYDSPVGGSQFGPMLCSDNVTVQNGVFSVGLDFGAQFAGQARYLEIELRPDSGLGCANPAGFIVLGPRQELSASPNAAFSLNAGSLGGQPGSYYLNGANFTGTIPDARLSTTIPRITGSQTFSGINTFNNAGNTFTGAYFGSGAGLTALNAASVSTGILADARLSPNIPRLDGANTFSAVNTFGNAGNAFTGSGAGLTSLNASSLASGTVGDARLSGNIPRLNTPNAFTAANSFSANSTFTGNLGIGAPPAFPLDLTTGVQTAVNVVGGNTGGTWFNLRNTSGRQWQIISTGTANGEGAGKLLFRDGTANAVRMTFDTVGNIGVGTTSPASPFDLAMGDKRLQFRSDGGLVPGINLSGTGANLGTMRLRNAMEIWPSDAGDRPGYLDVRNASGVTTISLEGATGRVNAKNMPAVAASQYAPDARNTLTWTDVPTGQNLDLAALTVNVPGAGFLCITASANIEFGGYSSDPASTAFLKLSETTGGSAVQLAEIAHNFDLNFGGTTEFSSQSTVSLTWVVPTNPGQRSFVINLFAQTRTFVGYRALNVLYIPNGM